MFENLGIAPADMLLPNCNLSKWSVIACDQYTAQADYWRHVDETVGDAPSSLRLILPEAYLHKQKIEDSLEVINSTMEKYLKSGLFYEQKNAMIYVERAMSDGSVRKGLVCKVDLEHYDFNPESKTMIRATEKTVLERIPARVKIRENAALELPHIMVLVNDGKRELLAPLAEKKETMEKLYGFTLMEGGGRIDGWRLDDASVERLAEDLSYLKGEEELLFAVGDGNHSLAAAKTIYERDKANTPEEEWAQLPSRWVLAEIVSLEDPAVKFLPIHRIVFGVDFESMLAAFKEYYPDVIAGEGEGHTIRWCCKDETGVCTVPHPAHMLAVETLQSFLDDYVAKHGGTIDYIHDMEAVEEMSRQTKTVGFLLPEFPRETLFPYVAKCGALPRKTFSIGHSQDKRYYLEARALRSVEA